MIKVHAHVPRDRWEHLQCGQACATRRAARSIDTESAEHVLDVVYGESRNRDAAKALADLLHEIADEGAVYLGYPVPATADERVEVDALLISQKHGLVAFLSLITCQPPPRSGPRSWPSRTDSMPYWRAT
jgi:hypothetical protein